MKRIACVAFPPSAAPGGLPACGSDASPANTAPTADARNTFLDSLNSVYPQYEWTTDDVDAGRDACIVLESGASGLETVYQLIEWEGYDAEQAGAVMGAAIMVYCPSEYAHVDLEFAEVGN